LKIIFSRRSDIGWSAVKRLHPFDGQKFSRAWNLLEEKYGSSLYGHVVDPSPWLDRARALLPTVHTTTYLASLKSANTIAGIVEIPVLRWVPSLLLKKVLIDPMMIACAGACAAAEVALQEGFTFNFGGGFHHAHADHGEGFCVFNDIAIARQHLIQLGKLTIDDTIWIIDLDAHRGNGNEDIFLPSANVRFLDLYNSAAYPGPLRDLLRFPHLQGMPEHMGVASTDRPRRSTELYLSTLTAALGAFVNANPRPKIVFYNAGTDIVVGDPLGRLSVSENGVVERDRLVIETLRQNDLPIVMLTSGGYTDKSHRLIARTASWALDLYAARKPLNGPAV
jgi:histone deacetylase 11